jgi:hypothetical protein
MCQCANMQYNFPYTLSSFAHLQILHIGTLKYKMFLISDLFIRQFYYKLHAIY